MNGMRHNQHIKQGLTMLCIAMFLFNYANASLFWHGHTVCGRWIFHSHFASKAHRTLPEGNSHTDFQLILIQTLNASSCTEEAIPAYEMEPFRQLVAIQGMVTEWAWSPGTALHSVLRGPPALV